MAMSPETVPSQEYVDFDEYIDIQLRKTGSTIKLTDVLTAMVGVSTLVTFYLLLFVVCDHWLIPGGFSAPVRAAMLVAVGLSACCWIGMKVLLPWRRRVSGLYAASTIEKASPGLKSTLLNLVDLSRSGREVRPEIRGSIERRAALALSHVDVSEAVDRRSLLRLSVALLAVVVIFCLYWVLSPKNPGTSLWRALVPTAQVGVATRTEIYPVRPGDVDVIARSQLDVTADLHGEIPPQVWLYFTTADHKFVDERVAMRPVDDTSMQFRCPLNGENGAGILQSMSYRIIAGDAESGPYHIRVIQPPSAAVDSIRLEYPEYTRRPPVVQSAGPIDALEGTRVILKATANMPLNPSARLQFFDDQTATKRAEDVRINVTDGTKLQADWKLELRPDATYGHFYRIFCTNTNGESDPNPSLYSLTIRPDLPPVVVLRDPKTDLELPANAVLPLAIEARDPDFTLRYVRLNCEKNGSPILVPDLYDGHDQQFKTTYEWALKDYHFRPNDTITYWIQAQDNRQPIANTANSPRMKIRIVEPVSDQQVAKNLDHAKQKQQQEAQAADAEHSAERNAENSDDGKEQASADDPATERKKHSDSKAGRKQQPAGQQQSPEKNAQRQEDTKRPGEQGQSGDGDEGNGQGAGKEKNSAGKGGGSKQQPLDPNNPSDDAKVLDTLNRLDQKDQEKENGSEGGNGKSKAEQRDKVKPADSQTKQGEAGSPGQDDKSESHPKATPERSEKRAQPGKDPGDEKGKAEKAGKSPSPDKQDGTKQPGDEKPNSDKNVGANSPKENGADKSEAAKPDAPSQTSPEKNRQDALKKDGKSAENGGPKDENAKPDEKKPENQGAAKDSGSKDDPGKGESGKEKPAASDRKSPANEKSEKDSEQNGKDKDTASQPANAKPSGKNRQSEEFGKQGKDAEQKPDDQSQSGGQKSDSKDQQGGKEQTDKKSEQAPSDSAKGQKHPGKGSGGQPQADQSSDSSDRKNDDRKQPSDGQESGRPKPDQAKSEKGAGKTGESPSASKHPDKNDDAVGDRKSDPSQKDPSRAGESSKDPTAQDGKPGDRQPKDPKKPSRTDPAKPVDEKDAPPSEDRKTEIRNAPPGTKPPRDARRTTQRPDEEPAPSDRKDNEPGAKTVNPKRQPPDSQTPPADNEPSPTSKSEVGSRDAAKEQAADKKNSDAARESQQPGEPKQEGQKGSPKPGTKESPQGESQPGAKQDSKAQSGDAKEQAKSDSQNPSKDDSSQPGGKGKPGKADSTKPSDDKSSSSKSSSGAPKGNQQSPGEGTSQSSGGGHNNGTSRGAGESLKDTQADANLQYAKQATDLVLNRLDHQLQRGAVDEKILKELGWTPEQVRRFVERMRKQVQSAQSPASPADEARAQQLFETWRSMPSAAQRRTSQGAPKRQADEIGSTRSIPPPEYRDLYDAFTRSVARQPGAPVQDPRKK